MCLIVVKFGDLLIRDTKAIDARTNLLFHKKEDEARPIPTDLPQPNMSDDELNTRYNQMCKALKKRSAEKVIDIANSQSQPSKRS